MNKASAERLSKQLKSCPCCGELARVETNGIRCLYCGLLLPTTYKSRKVKHEALVSFWNRRDEGRSWGKKIRNEVKAIACEDDFIDDVDLEQFQ